MYSQLHRVYTALDFLCIFVVLGEHGRTFSLTININIKMFFSQVALHNKIGSIDMCRN